MVILHFLLIINLKHGLNEADWYSNRDQLMGKVEMKSCGLYRQPILCTNLRELCAIRDTNSICDLADTSDNITLTEDLC